MEGAMEDLQDMFIVHSIEEIQVTEHNSAFPLLEMNCNFKRVLSFVLSHFLIRENVAGDIPGSLVVETELPLQEAEVCSLVGNLRLCPLRNKANTHTHRARKPNAPFDL